MKRIIVTLALTCALSVSAFAGEIPTCGPTAVTGEVPINGSPVAGNMATVDSSTVSFETESSVLTEVLLTLVALIVR